MSLSRRALRHEPLGVDLDGRYYYALSPRAVEDDSRPPVGWASGLLVWGIGVHKKAKEDSEEDDLPVVVQRWSHFGKSTPVKQLAKWIEWRTKKALEATRPTRNSSAKAVSLARVTSRTKKTPTDVGAATKPVQSILQMRPFKASSMPKHNDLVEVVIPVSAKKTNSNQSSLSTLSSSPSGSNSVKPGVSGTSSALSTPPTSSIEDLLALSRNEHYEPSAVTVEESGKELVRRLLDVSEWLAVLEWRGMGEVY